MRITGGSRRGQRLVPWQEEGIRPMRDFVRLAMFNIIAHLVDGARFLDLFCGTGSVGLEALSRGAKGCVFVDSSVGACRVVRKNLDALSLLERGVVIHADYSEAMERLERRGRKFDLVFVGPPYGEGLAPEALQALGTMKLLSGECFVITEVFHKEELEATYGRLNLNDRRVYGDNVLWFYEVGAS